MSKLSCRSIALGMLVPMGCVLSHAVSAQAVASPPAPIMTCTQDLSSGGETCYGEGTSWSVAPYGDGVFLFGLDTVYMQGNGAGSYQMPTTKGVFTSSEVGCGVTQFSGTDGSNKATLGSPDAKGRRVLQMEGGKVIRCTPTKVDNEGSQQVITTCAPYNWEPDPAPVSSESY